MSKAANNKDNTTAIGSSTKSINPNVNDPATVAPIIQYSSNRLVVPRPQTRLEVEYCMLRKRGGFFQSLKGKKGPTNTRVANKEWKRHTYTLLSSR
jgi:hypothetical protein